MVKRAGREIEREIMLKDTLGGHKKESSTRPGVRSGLSEKGG